MPLAPAPRWHDEVPGTRWFRADLHLHTLDDHDGGRVRLPPELAGGDPRDPALLRRYAHAVLDAAVERGVEVLGLTPHDVRTGPTDSAAWAIVEAWLEDSNEQGRAYRDLVYAVFPGFEPAFNIGQRCLHLLFLFDPCIGRDRYLRLFDALMGGVSPWEGNTLRISALDEEQLFVVLDDFHRRENEAAGNVDRWEYLLLAPHAFADNGLFGALKSQALQMFPSDRLSGIELGDNQMPEDVVGRRPWLLDAMRDHRHGFYHASDAYGLEPDPAADALYKVGSRVTLTKLAAPTIAAVRQSLLAEESRIRLAYRRVSPGQLAPAADLPHACPVDRPWIRSVEVRGGTSFHRDRTFRLSPDLTCIIGGSMTGKSALLDGLRYHLAGEPGLPSQSTERGKALARDVRERARDVFLSGNPDVVVESPAGDPTLPGHERFGVRFFTQGELKTLSEDDDGIERLLFHLVPGRAEELLRERDALRQHDEELWSSAVRLAKLQEQVGEAEQALVRTEDARTAMERFARAGSAALPPAQQDAARTADLRRDAGVRLEQARELVGQIEALSVPVVNSDVIRTAIAAEDDGATTETLLAQARASALATVEALGAVHRRAGSAAATARTEVARLTAEVQAALVAAGGSASDLNQFEAFARVARHHDSFQAAADQKVGERDRLHEAFNEQVALRDQLVERHRHAVQAVCAEVGARFDGRVVVQLQEEGRRRPLEDWLLGLRTKGVTQWWNSGGAQSATGTAVRDIATAVGAGDSSESVWRCASLGMSEAVSRSFQEQLAPWARQLEARALRTPDRYQIQWVEDGEPKDIDKLSGGRKVAVLLSLLLQSDDPTPLVVDQPEDELDNRFLNDTIIPALHRLKGRRQVIFATHNANIVVNGDADQVIALEADAHHGRVYAAGAIEEPAVRQAILRTLDGGEEAFELRRAKYGF